MALKSKNLTLSDLITEDTIEINARVKDWRQAVRKAGNVLVGIDAVEPKYIDAMLKLVEDIGPYIVIAQGVAIPHARPEDGAKRIAMSLVTLDKPVNFNNPDNDPVDIVIAFAGRDNKSHVKVLAELMRLLEKPENLRKMREATTKEKILQML